MRIAQVLCEILPKTFWSLFFRTHCICYDCCLMSQIVSTTCKPWVSNYLKLTPPLTSSWLRHVPTLKSELENVAIANALQLEAARRRAVPIRFNFVARAKFEVAQPIGCRLRAFYCLYVTLRCDLELWPRDLDLWPLTLNICGEPALP